MVDTAVACEYSAEDADVTWRLYEYFFARLQKEPALKKLFEEVEMPLVCVLQKMERNGVFLDTRLLKNMSGELNKELAKTLTSTNLSLSDLKTWDQGGDHAKKITPLGYFGDPASFDPETSKKRMEGLAKTLADLIENFLKENEVEYEYVDVDLCNEDELEQIRKDIFERTGSLSYPTIIIDEKVLITGFVKDKIVEVLET
jgi:glutaredoxin